MSDLLTSEEQQPPAVGLPSSATSTAQFGVIVFLASDVMLFAPFFAAYFLLRANNQPWPPEGVELNVPRAFFGLLLLMTSSVTFVLAERAGVRPGGRGAMRRWLLVTMALGSAFLVNQLLEYASLDFGADTPYGSVFYTLTGLHGLHVLTGVAAIGLLFVRAVRSRDHRDIAAWEGGVSLFWHLVDVIWVLVFSTIWLLR